MSDLTARIEQHLSTRRDGNRASTELLLGEAGRELEKLDKSLDLILMQVRDLEKRVRKLEK